MAIHAAATLLARMRACPVAPAPLQPNQPPPPPTPPATTQAAEHDLSARLASCQAAVHSALCDNLNTAAAMDALSDVIKATNVYLVKQQVWGGGVGGGESPC